MSYTIDNEYGQIPVSGYEALYEKAVDTVLTDNTEAMSEAIQKISDIDIKGLNDSIKKLNDAVDSLNRALGGTNRNNRNR